jgi:hypothetical protein
MALDHQCVLQILFGVEAEEKAVWMNRGIELLFDQQHGSNNTEHFS